jgi:WD40 repeat protein
MLSSGDGYIQLWDTLTGTLIKSFENHIGRLVRFSNDGEFIIVASGKKIFKLETNSGTCIKEFHEHSSSIDCISVSSDNKYLASVCDNGEGRIWNIKNGKIINTFIGYNTVHFSPDGHSILTSKGLNLLEYKISSGLLERVFLSDIKKGYWIWSAIYSSDGKYIISASYDNTVKLWDRVLSKCFYIFDAPNTRSIAISPSCNILVTGDSKGILKIWDLCTYRCICTLNHHNNIISSLIFFGDNKHLVSGSIDKSIRIWEIGYPF